MKKWILFVGFIICVLVASIVLQSSSCRLLKQRQLHHDGNHNAVTSLLQTTSNDNQINGQKTAPYTLSKEVNNALEYGAKAKVTLKVVDSSGNSVPGAHVHVHFTFYNRSKNEITGVTDSSGMFTAEKETTLSFQWNIQKDGYYATNGKHFLTDGLSNESVKNGRWQPWNQTIEVVLKEKHKPIPLYTRLVDKTFPKNEQIGFDCLYADFVAPFGKGEVADFVFLYESEVPSIHSTLREWSYLTNSLTIVAPTGGFITKHKDLFSIMISDYEAPKNGYINIINYEYKRAGSEIFKEKKLNKDEYLFFYIRATDSHNGKMRNACYGKIYTFAYGESLDIENTATLRISYYLNPEPNDRNLEFDGVTNLFNPDWRDYKWPKEP